MISIGDVVILVDDGETYDSYGYAANKLNIENWHRGYLPAENELYILKGIWEERYSDSSGSYFTNEICWIENCETKKGYLVGIGGLELISREEFITQEEMEI